MRLDRYCYDGGKKFNCSTFDTAAKDLTVDKNVVLETSALNISQMQLLQDKFYAEGKEALLIILQAMDAGGKDGAIKHVMGGLNPQGVEVTNFKQPSNEELAHDYLWRAVKALPIRGKIGIFNRSYYEDVLIGKVRETYKLSNLPKRCTSDDVIEKRYQQIVDFEKYLWENGTRVIKFFINISKDEQKKRFLKRIDEKSKNWKLSDSDIKERALWDQYMSAYESAINHTATEYAPWYVVPSDKKWFSRYFISEIIVNTLNDMNPKYPKVTKEKEAMVLNCKELLMVEDINVATAP